MMMDLPQPKKNREYAVIFLSYYYIALIIKYYITVKSQKLRIFNTLQKKLPNKISSKDQAYIHISFSKLTSEQWKHMIKLYV